MTFLKFSNSEPWYSYKIYSHKKRVIVIRKRIRPRCLHPVFTLFPYQVRGIWNFSTVQQHIQKRCPPQIRFINALRKAHSILLMGMRVNKKARENSHVVEFLTNKVLTAVDFNEMRYWCWKIRLSFGQQGTRSRSTTDVWWWSFMFVNVNGVKMHVEEYMYAFLRTNGLGRVAGHRCF